MDIEEGEVQEEKVSSIIKEEAPGATAATTVVPKPSVD